MTPQQQQTLIDSAIAARGNAYAPYSNFLVGAALLTDNGGVVAGANVENASYGLTLCAERVAAGAAVAAGARGIVAVAVATEGGAAPCGACRQFLNEFGSAMTVLCVDSASGRVTREVLLSELLPESFGPAALGGTRRP
ncbi:Cytidine deaminase [Pirellulimonas nuda]|uniref:Cytidine deaminase n=1 Tax=Pirellulimonas nuda TaxID=2528009 RepID=A0A518DEP8_9BACT|nr:cytidine deaminase [Pirellulimonas nuda]QDU89948.1 Cytidine deaminase [Pirellulimonas nuda]